MQQCWSSAKVLFLCGVRSQKLCEPLGTWLLCCDFRLEVDYDTRDDIAALLFVLILHVGGCVLYCKVQQWSSSSELLQTLYAACSCSRCRSTRGGCCGCSLATACANAAALQTHPTLHARLRTHVQRVSCLSLRAAVGPSEFQGALAELHDWGQKAMVLFACVDSCTHQPSDCVVY
jgi:hypothetical protein